MTDFDQAQRVVRIKSLNFKDRDKLIFEWVKTGVINLSQFRELLRVN